MKRYPGISPFTFDDKDIFFGREKDVAELAKLIRIYKKVLLYSKSGYGKTSLVKAGVIPELKTVSDLEIIEVRFWPFDNKSQPPVTNLIQTVKNHKDINEKDYIDTITYQYIPEYKENLWHIFKTNQLAGRSAKTYLLIFDQFEELFSYPEDQIKQLKIQLANILNDNNLPDFFNEFEDIVFNNEDKIKSEDIDTLYKPLNVKALFIIRSDKLSFLNKLTDYIPDIQRNFYELKALDVEQARQAIVNPAKVVDPRFDSPSFEYTDVAVDKIISYLTKNYTESIETTQLQIICQRVDIIASKMNGDKIVITENDIPEFKNIFLEFYENTLSLIDENDLNNVRQLIEDQMISDKQRIPVHEKICLTKVSRKSLDILIDTHLIRGERSTTGGFTYELSHDTLIEPILEKRNQRKLEEQQQKEEAKRQAQLKRFYTRILITVLSVSTLISIALGIFAYTKMKDAQNAAINLYVNEAQTFMNQEEFNKAKSKYAQLYNDFEFYAKKNGIIDSIKKCDSLLMIKSNFYQYIQSADSLISVENDNIIDKVNNYLKADTLYNLADSLNYPYGNNILIDKRKSLTEMKRNAIPQLLNGYEIFKRAEIYDFANVYKNLADKLQQQIEEDNNK